MAPSPIAPAGIPAWRLQSPAIQPGFHAGRAPATKGKKMPAEVYSHGEVMALIGACSRGAVGARNAALLAMLYRGGFRHAEVLALRPKDVDADQCTVRVLHGKGDEPRLVVIDPDTCAYLDRWETKRTQLGIAAGAPLFCTISSPQRGRPLDDSYLRHLLPKLASRAGIDRRVHPHGFRHTMAVQMRLRGFDLRLIQQQLGHKSLDTTAHYMDKLSPLERIERLRARPWGDPPAAAATPPPDLLGEFARVLGVQRDQVGELVELLRDS